MSWTSKKSPPAASRRPASGLPPPGTDPAAAPAGANRRPTDHPKPIAGPFHGIAIVPFQTRTLDARQSVPALHAVPGRHDGTAAHDYRAGRAQPRAAPTAAENPRGRWLPA